MRYHMDDIAMPTIYTGYVIDKAAPEGGGGRMKSDSCNDLKENLVAFFSPLSLIFFLSHFFLNFLLLN